MHVVVLGGAGGVGLAAAKALMGGVDEVVIADRDVEGAKRAAATLGGSARAQAVDVTDSRGLAELLGGTDVALNTVGPFFRYGVRVLRAAIDAGCDYVDVCDDPAPTLEMLDLDAAARAAGVTCVVGMGASPGLCNLLAVQAMDGLEGPAQVLTGWNIDGAQSPGSESHGAAVIHGLEQVTGTVPTVQGSRRVQGRPLQPVSIEYPGLGSSAGRTFGHPEAVTLPLWNTEISDCSNVVTGRATTLGALRTLAWLVNHRLLSAERAARLAGAMESLMPSSAASMMVHATLPPLFAHATGFRDGEPVTQAVALAHFPGLFMSHMTGIPAAVGTLHYPRNPGVHAPETSFSPSEFFTHLAPFCHGSPAPETVSVSTTSLDSEEDNAERLRRASIFGAILTA